MRTEIHSIEKTEDGGFIAAGYTESNDGDVSGNHGGSSDGWIVKVDSEGEMEWQNCLGGSRYDLFYSVKKINGDNYIIVGRSNSNDEDVSGNHGGSDAWVVKIK